MMQSKNTFVQTSLLLLLLAAPVVLGADPLPPIDEPAVDMIKYNPEIPEGQRRGYGIEVRGDPGDATMVTIEWTNKADGQVVRTGTKVLKNTTLADFDVFTGAYDFHAPFDMKCENGKILYPRYINNAWQIVNSGKNEVETSGTARIEFLSNTPQRHMNRIFRATSFTAKCVAAGPSPGPTYAPTMAPTPCPTKQDGTKSGSCHGDPHFRLWSGERFDFHGGCDLVLLQNPGYQGGLGLDIHIRTKVRSFYSYIESAAVRIGDDIFEVLGGEGEEDDHNHSHWLNGEEGAELPAMISSGYQIDVIDKSQPKRKHLKKVYEISPSGDGSSDEKIVIEVFKRFVSVRVKNAHAENYGGSLGLMGDFDTEGMVARDGISVIQDADSFGFEWQVRGDEEDPKLFHNMKGPQHPAQQCIMPSETAISSRRRQLRSDGFQAKAEEACAVVGEEDREVCLFDVVATGDTDMAEAFL